MIRHRFGYTPTVLYLVMCHIRVRNVILIHECDRSGFPREEDSVAVGLFERTDVSSLIVRTSLLERVNVPRYAQ